jgi:hypothetical protein
MTIVRPMITYTFILLFATCGFEMVAKPTHAKSDQSDDRLEGIGVPLAQESSAAVDKALVGRWACTRNEDGGITRVDLLVLRFNDHTYYAEFSPSSLGQNGTRHNLSDAVLQYRMFTAIIEGERFMNFQGIGLNDDRSYVFCGYKISNGNLILREVRLDIFPDRIGSIDEARRIVAKRLITGSIYKPLPIKCHKVR